MWHQKWNQLKRKQISISLSNYPVALYIRLVAYFYNYLWHSMFKFRILIASVLWLNNHINSTEIELSQCKHVMLGWSTKMRFWYTFRFCHFFSTCTKDIKTSLKSFYTIVYYKRFFHNLSKNLALVLKKFTYTPH